MGVGGSEQKLTNKQNHLHVPFAHPNRTSFRVIEANLLQAWCGSAGVQIETMRALNCQPGPIIKLNK